MNSKAKKMFTTIAKIIKYQLNIPKTILFNLKAFPLRVAIRLPVLIFGKVIFELDRGCINILSHKGKIRIGTSHCEGVHGDRPFCTTIVRIHGNVNFGGNVWIANGCVLSIKKGGVLTVMDDVFINVCSRIAVYGETIIGQGSRISWDSQIFDTNFHYTISKDSISNHTGKIIIGDYCWIGNRVTVSKGCVLPPHSIVASNSLINKDFSNNSENCLYGGTPAKMITQDIRRIFDFNFEYFLNEWFKENEGPVNYDVVFQEYEKKKV